MRIFSGGKSRSFSLLFADILSAGSTIAAVFCICKLLGAEYKMSIVLRTWPIVTTLVIFNIFGRLYCGNLFYPGLIINPVEELRRLTLSCFGSFLLFFAITNITRSNLDFSRAALLLSMLFTAIALPMGRIVVRYLLWRFKKGAVPALITGDADLAETIAVKMAEDNYSTLVLRGSCCSRKIADNIQNYSPDELPEFSKQHKINYLIYCNHSNDNNAAMEKYLSYFLHVLVVNDTERFPVLWSYPVSFYRYFSFEISNRLLRKTGIFQKRILEIVLSAAGLLLSVVPCIILALLVKISSPGPVFYRAKRLGKNGKPIEVIKFRTMVCDADDKLEKIFAENPELQKEWEKKFKLENDPRITRIGKFLRKTSLDELPQFWNVIKGEMALIGPRPIVEKEIGYYGKDYQKLASVKPGITGLWQVSGRSSTSYDERVALDVFYVNNWSVWMDYYIFIATFNAVLFHRGAE